MKLSVGSGIGPDPNPLPAALSNSSTPERCSGAVEKNQPQSCSGQHKPDRTQRNKLLLWLTSSGSYPPGLQQLQLSLRTPLYKGLRKDLSNPEKQTGSLQQCREIDRLWAHAAALKACFHFTKTLMIYILRALVPDRAQGFTAAPHAFISAVYINPMYLE